MLFLLNSDVEAINNKTKILESLIPKFKKNDILLITFSKKIYLKYKNQDFNIIYISFWKWTLKFQIIKKVKFKYLIKALNICHTIDVYENILENYKIDLVLTTQDHEPLDYSLTMLAKEKKIKTISHQHALFIEDAGYEYYYSDYLMLWGERSIEFLARKAIKKNCFIVGTNKYNFLLQYRKIKKRKLVLCMTNNGNEYAEMKLINKFNDLPFENGEKVIKLHPSIDKKDFIKKYKNIKNNIKISMGYSEIIEAKYLLTYQTTAFLDGLFCGASVLNICIDELKENKIPCKIKYENIDEELLKRESDKIYFDKILRLQEEELKKQILYTNSEIREKKIIDQILEKNYINFEEEKENVK